MDATRSNSSKLDATAPKFGSPMAKWFSMAAPIPLFPGDAMAAKEKTLTKKSEDRRRQRARRKLARTVSDALSAAAVATAAAVSALATTSVSSASSAAFAVIVRAPSPARHGAELEDENQHGTAAAAAALAEEDEEDEVNDEVDVDDEAAMDDEAEWYDEAVLDDEVEQHTGAEKIGERAGTVAIANSTVLTFATGDTNRSSTTAIPGYVSDKGVNLQRVNLQLPHTFGVVPPSAAALPSTSLPAGEKVTDVTSSGMAVASLSQSPPAAQAALRLQLPPQGTTSRIGSVTSATRAAAAAVAAAAAATVSAAAAAAAAGAAAGAAAAALAATRASPKKRRKRPAPASASSSPLPSSPVFSWAASGAVAAPLASDESVSQVPATAVFLPVAGLAPSLAPSIAPTTAPEYAVRGGTMSEYELQRAKNVEDNKQVLDSLGLLDHSLTRPKEISIEKMRRKLAQLDRHRRAEAARLLSAGGRRPQPLLRGPERWNTSVRVLQPGLIVTAAGRARVSAEALIGEYVEHFDFGGLVMDLVNNSSGEKEHWLLRLWHVEDGLVILENPFEEPHTRRINLLDPLGAAQVFIVDPPVSPLGTKWLNVGAKRPDGTEIYSEQLVTALRTRHDLCKKDIKGLKIKDLRQQSFILVDGEYFIPAPSIRLRGAWCWCGASLGCGASSLPLLRSICWSCGRAPGDLTSVTRAESFAYAGRVIRYAQGMGGKQPTSTPQADASSSSSFALSTFLTSPRKDTAIGADRDGDAESDTSSLVDEQDTQLVHLLSQVVTASDAEEEDSDPDDEDFDLARRALDITAKEELRMRARVAGASVGRLRTAGRRGDDDDDMGTGRTVLPLRGVGPVGTNEAANRAAFEEAMASGGYLPEPHSSFSSTGHMVLNSTMDQIDAGLLKALGPESLTSEGHTMGQILRALLAEIEATYKHPVHGTPPDVKAHHNVEMYNEGFWARAGNFVSENGIMDATTYAVDRGGARVYATIDDLPDKGDDLVQNMLFPAQPRTWDHAHTSVVQQESFSMISQLLGLADAIIDLALTPTLYAVQSTDLISKFRTFDDAYVPATKSATSMYLAGESPGEDVRPMAELIEPSADQLARLHHLATQLGELRAAVIAYRSRDERFVSRWADLSGLSPSPLQLKPVRLSPPSEKALGKRPAAVEAASAAATNESPAQPSEKAPSEKALGKRKVVEGNHAAKGNNAAAAPVKRKVLDFHWDMMDKSGQSAWASGCTGLTTIMAHAPQAGKGGTSIILAGVDGHYPRNQAEARLANIHARKCVKGARRVFLGCGHEGGGTLCRAFLGPGGLVHGAERLQPLVRGQKFRSRRAILYTGEAAHVASQVNRALPEGRDGVWSSSARKRARLEGRMRSTEEYIHKKDRRERFIVRLDEREVLEFFEVLLRDYARGIVLGAFLRMVRWEGRVCASAAMNQLVNDNFAPCTLSFIERRFTTSYDLMVNLVKALKCRTTEVSALAVALLRIAHLFPRLNALAHSEALRLLSTPPSIDLLLGVRRHKALTGNLCKVRTKGLPPQASPAKRA